MYHSIRKVTMKNAKQKKLGLLISTILGMQAVYALPQGAQVVQGSAAISTPNSSTMNITNSNNAVINWQQFNIGTGQTTNFIQPNSASSVLNRVISNNPSQILGNLNSNGQVFLINQHGILVGEGSRINTNGFFASTLNITNDDFLKGDLNFKDGGLGGINNKGYIHAGEDGNVVLIAPNIENGGVIEVENGNIILAAGESITISSLDNASVEFQVQASDNKVTNLGSVIAKNGAASLFAGTLKHSGTIRATGLVRDKNGIIRLVALDKTEVSGSVDVSGNVAGNIEILGDVVDIQQGANIDASSNAGAGEILIGGDQQGLNPNIQNATSTTVAAGAQIHADGMNQGDGGKVIVFAKNDVHIQGDITAKGGDLSGDGGFIETSGLKQLDITSIPDASAVNGEAGEWLIDPNNITIQTTGADTNVTNISGVIDTVNDGAIITTATIANALDAGTNVTISTGIAGNNTELGDITINNAIVPTGSTIANLTLNAHNDINVNADIGGTATFNITLTADSDINGSGDINFGNAILNTRFGDLTLSGNAINVIGLTSIENNNSIVTLNAPLTIFAGANLTLANNGFSTMTVDNTGGIKNDGTLIIFSPCGDGCSTVSINGNFDNNAVINFNSGILASTGVLNLNAGTVLNAVTPFQGAFSQLTIEGILKPNVSITFDQDLQLGLTNGTINSFENIKISNNFNIDGGTINFNSDIALPNSVTTYIGNTATPLVLNGPSSGAFFTLEGATNFAANLGSFDINLSNTNLVNKGDWSFNGFSFGTGTSAGMNGTNSTFSLLNDSRLIFNSPLNHTISVPVETQGTIELVNAVSNVSFTGAGGLTLKNGGRLSGIGTYTGDVIVDQGGQISPGLYGNTRDNTGILNIVGNVSFNAGSVGIWEIDDDGINFDQLNVTGSGNVSINNADLFLFWDTLLVVSPTLQGPFTLIQATGAITQTSPILHDLPSITGSNIAVMVGNGNSLQYTPAAAGAINHWTGGSSIAPTDWNDGANWFSGAVPTLGQTLVIESGSTIDLSIATANLGDVQLDANLNINAGGSLNGTGILTNLQDINILTSSSDVAGTGVWNNLLAVFADDSIILSRATFNNFGGFNWSTPNSTTANLAFTGSTFNNVGTVTFHPLNTTNGIDFSGSQNGLINAGLTVFNIGGSTTDFTGILNNTTFGVLSIVSPNSGAGLALGTNNTNNGEIFLKDTTLALSSGVTFNLSASSSLTGAGLYDIGVGSTLVTDNVTFGSGLNVDLNGGTLGTTSNFTLSSILTLNGGSITGTTGNTFTADATSTINIAASTGDAILNTINMISNGTVNFTSSANDFVLNNAAVWTNAGTFNINNSGGAANLQTNIGADGSFINTGIVNSDPTATTNNIDFFIPVDNQGVINVIGDIFEISRISTSSGTINISTGASFILGSGFTDGINNTKLTLSGTPIITGSGTFGIQTDTTLDTAVIASMGSGLTLQLEGSNGKIDNAQLLTLPNMFNWNGGKIVGSGIFTIPNTTTVNMTGTTGNMYIDGTTPNTIFTLQNDGTVNFTSANSSNDFRVDNKAVWLNNGILNLMNASNGAAITGLSGANGSFVNDTAGIINSAPSATLNPTLSIFIPFDNRGTINVASNTAFETNDIVADSGTIDIGNGGIFQIDHNINSQGISNSSLTLSGAPVISGGGTFVVDDGVKFDVAVPVTFGPNLTLTLQGTGEIQNANNLTLPNVFNWNSGTVTGVGTLNALSTTINIAATTGDAILDTINMTSNGIVNFTSSVNDLVLNNASTWTNAGTFNIANTNNNADLISNAGLTGSFINAGLLNVASAGANFDTQIPFTNSGTVDISSGVILTLSDTFDWTSGTVKGLGLLNTLATSSTTLGGTSNVTLDGNWKNEGTVNWVSSAGDFLINGLMNNAIGSFNVATISDTVKIGGSGSFVNDASFVFAASAGSTSANIAPLFTNNGTIDFNKAGYIAYLSNDFSNFGNINFNANARFNVNAGSTFTAQTGSGINGAAGQVSVLSGSTLDFLGGNNFFSGSVTLTLNNGGNFTNVQNLPSNVNSIVAFGGTITGDGSTWTIPSSAVFTLGLAGDLTLSNINVLNQGAMVFNSATNNGVILSNANLALDNSSTLTVSQPSFLSGSGILRVDIGANLNTSSAFIFNPNVVLTLNGGSISNASNVSLPNIFNWNSGTVSGIGTLTVPSSTTVNMTGIGGNMILSTVDMLTSGIVNYSASSNGFVLSNNANWTNAGTLNLTSNAGISATNSTTASFLNTGILNYSAVGLATFGIDFNSTGSLNIQSGSLGLTSTASFDGNVDIASGSILGLNGGASSTVSLLSNSAFTGQGSIASTSNLQVADAVTIDPQLTVNTATIDFEGGAVLSSLVLNSSTININTLGVSSVGNSLDVTNLSWNSGSINGNSSTPTNLVTSGNSSLLSGNLSEIDWLNQGQLNWLGSNAEILALTNSTFTNVAGGILNITNSSALGSINDSGQLKSISGGSGNLVNNGTINLINADLSLNGVTLLLGSNTSVLNGSGSITGNVVNTAGLVALGDPLNPTTSGALTINGDYTQGANGALQVRIVDPINGQFSFDTFTVNGTANLDGQLRISYFSNQVVSVTESFNPFSFTNRNGIFSSLVDSNGNILAIEFSNGGFTILGTSNSSSGLASLQEIVQSQEEFEKILEVIRDEELNGSLAFINQIIDENDEDEEKAKKRGPKLVCR